METLFLFPLPELSGVKFLLVPSLLRSSMHSPLAQFVFFLFTKIICSLVAEILRSLSLHQVWRPSGQGRSMPWTYPLSMSFPVTWQACQTADLGELAPKSFLWWLLWSAECFNRLSLPDSHVKIPPLNPKFGGGTAKLRVVAAKLVEDYQNAKKRKAKALNAASQNPQLQKPFQRDQWGF